MIAYSRKDEVLRRLKEAGLPMPEVLKALDGIQEVDYFGMMTNYADRIRHLECQLRCETAWRKELQERVKQQEKRD